MIQGRINNSRNCQHGEKYTKVKSNRTPPLEEYGVNKSTYQRDHQAYRMHKYH